MTEKQKVGRPKGKATLAKEALEVEESWLKNKPRQMAQKPSSLSTALQGNGTWKQARKSYNLGHRNISNSLALDHLKISEGSDREYETRNPQAPKFDNLKNRAEDKLRELQKRVKQKASQGGKRSRSNTFHEQIAKTPKAMHLMTKLLNKEITFEFAAMMLVPLGITASTSTLQRWLKANRSSAH